MFWLPTIMLDWWNFRYNAVLPVLQRGRFMFELFEALGDGLLLLAMIQVLRQLRDISGTAAR